MRTRAASSILSNVCFRYAALETRSFVRWLTSSAAATLLRRAEDARHFVAGRDEQLQQPAPLWLESGVEERAAALRVLAAFLQQGHGELHFGPSGSWRVTLDLASDRASLRAARYTSTARRWGTILPIVLDRYPKNRPNRDLADIVAQACLNVGLPERAVDGLRIESQQYSSIAGAPSVRAVADLLATDSPYRGRPMRHLSLTFTTPIQGPLVIGAGCYRGLGLCLPLGDEPAQ